MLKSLTATIFIFVICFFATELSALEQVPIEEVQLNKFVEDTQRKMPATGQRHVAQVWWVPLEYWRSVVGRDLAISDAQKETIFLSLRNISLLAAVQADLSTSGELEFYSKQEIEKNLAVTFSNADRKDKKLIPVNKLDPNLKTLLKQIAPLLRAAMGNLGDNFHFFVFDDVSDSGRTIDPYQQGLLSVDLKSKSEFAMNTEIEMPLDSLFYPRHCPNGKEAHVSWKFCPWSGEEPK